MVSDSRDSEIYINSRVSIPAAELRFKFSRASGPGGQFVQKVATRVQLLFDLAGSPSLSEEQKERALSALKTRIDKRGTMHLATQATRSQALNRKALIERFQRLLSQGLRIPKKRRPSRPTLLARERRLQAKKLRGEIKRYRAKVVLREEVFS